MTEPVRHDPYAALRIPNYRRYVIGNTISMLGMQMAQTTIGWELYNRTHSALVLGLVGLMQVVPVLLLSLPAGHVADRVNRKTIILLGTAVAGLVYLVMGLSSLFSVHLIGVKPLVWLNGVLASLSGLFGETKVNFSDPHVPVMLLLLMVSGTVRSFMGPAKQSLLPLLVEPKCFANAVTWNSSMFETTAVIGPMLAGGTLALIGWLNPESPWLYSSMYFAQVMAQGIMLVLMSRIQLAKIVRLPQAMTLRSMLAGARFVFSHKVILGAMTLDMFAVLFGGATALLPVFAKDVLHVGALGLGALRAAPSLGAVTMALMLAHRPPMQNAGRNLLWAVAGFGLATIVFGLSTYFWLSLLMLVLCGALDNVSVVIRHTLVQLQTPDDMRGRVNAVNTMFIASSNEIGALESGITAAIGIAFLGTVFGPMAAVVFGGLGTIAVVSTVAVKWPQLRQIKRLH